MIDYREYGTELFYQYALKGFSNYGKIELTDPLDIKQCVLLFIRHEQIEMKEEEMESLCHKVKSLIIEKKELLEEYFMVKMNDACEIVCLPMIMSGVEVQTGLIPKLLYDLYQVDWTDETLCFKGYVLKENEFIVMKLE